PVRPGREGRPRRRLVSHARPAHLADRAAPPGLVPGTARWWPGGGRRARPGRVPRLHRGVREPRQGGPVMAALSDQLLVYAILGYALAMLAYAVEYAFGSRSAVGRVATRELVGAGAPASPPPEAADAPPPAALGLAENARVA